MNKGSSISNILKIQLLVLASLFLFSCKTKQLDEYVEPGAASGSGPGGSSVYVPGILPKYDAGWRDNTISDFHIDGDNLYVASSGGFSPLKSFDLNTKELRLTCTRCKSKSGYEIVKYHDRLILAGRNGDGDLTVEIIDISNSSNFIPIGYYVDKGNASRTRHVLHSGKHIFLSLDNGDLNILDISKLSSIKKVASIDLGDGVDGSDISGTNLFAACGNDGLKVLDVSDITNPVVTKTVATGDYADQLIIDGNVLYLADWEAGFVIYDITDPVNPAVTGSYNTNGKTHDVQVSGNFLYASDQVEGAKVFDISDPSNPMLAKTLDDGAANTFKTRVVGNTLYSVDSTMGIREIDISTPATATFVGTPFTEIMGKRVDGISVDINRAYLGLATDGFVIVDTTDPLKPVTLGSFTKGTSNAHGVSHRGNHAFIAYGGFGLVVVDISDPTTPVQVGSYNTPGYSVGVELRGNYAYVADNNSIQIIDITDPTNPVASAAIATGTPTYDLAFDGNILIIGENATGLSLYDITDPTNPMIKSTVATTAAFTEISIKNHLAYVADSTNGLKIYDISNPSNPIKVGSIDSIECNGEVFIEQDHLYVSTSVGLQLFSISKIPHKPSPIGILQTGDNKMNEIKVLNGILHFANHNGGYKTYSF